MRRAAGSDPARRGGPLIESLARARDERAHSWGKKIPLGRGEGRKRLKLEAGGGLCFFFRAAGGAKKKTKPGTQEER